MKDAYIYIVGKPNTKSNTADIVREYGYKLGILADKKLTLNNPDIYDRVEYVDFANIDSEIDRLDNIDLRVKGLLCTYENYIIAKAKIGEYFSIASISLNSAILSTDKLLMREAFIRADPSITPNFSAISSSEEALNFANKHGYPLIIKPTNLVKSLLVLKCNNEKELLENFEYAHNSIKSLYKKYSVYDHNANLIIEEFITGKQCSIAAYVDANGKANFCDGIVKLTSAQDIGVDDNYLYSRHIPSKLSDELTDELYRISKVGIESLSMSSTPAHVELMYDGTSAKIIEIGPRTGGYRPRMYKYSYGIDLIEQEVRLALGEKPELSSSLQSFCAVYEIFPRTIGEFTGLINDIDQDSIAYHSVKAKIGNRIGPAKNGYKAAAIMIVSEKNEARFKEKCSLVENIEAGIRS